MCSDSGANLPLTYEIRRSGTGNISNMPDRQLGTEEIWDRFIDALDRAGQAGDAGGGAVPIFGTHGLGGRRLGDLTKDDVKALARIAGGLGRRSETIVTIWENMQSRARPPKPSKKQQRRR